MLTSCTLPQKVPRVLQVHETHISEAGLVHLLGKSSYSHARVLHDHHRLRIYQYLDSKHGEPGFKIHVNAVRGLSLLLNLPTHRVHFITESEF